MLQDIALRPEYAVPGVVITLEQATGAASDFARASKSAATRRAYQADAADFATAETIRAIIAEMPNDLRGLRAALARAFQATEFQEEGEASK